MLDLKCHLAVVFELIPKTCYIECDTTAPHDGPTGERAWEGGGRGGRTCPQTRQAIGQIWNDLPCTIVVAHNKHPAFNLHLGDMTVTSTGPNS